MRVLKHARITFTNVIESRATFPHCNRAAHVSSWPVVGSRNVFQCETRTRANVFPESVSLLSSRCTLRELLQTFAPTSKRPSADLDNLY